MNSPNWLQTVFIVATKEFRDCVRNRWLVIGAVLFGLLSVAIVFGTAAIGGNLDFRALPVVMNSCVSLTVFLLPLLALLISYDAFVGEQESGTLLLMLTYPMTRFQWLLGKLIGQGGALFLALLLGYIALPLMTLAGWLPYDFSSLFQALANIVWSGWLLGLIFILTAYFVSLNVRHKARALGFLLLFWLLVVLLYDLGLLVLSISAADAISRSVMFILMLVNPVSVFRLFNQSLLGIYSAPLSNGWLVFILGAWIVALLGLTWGVFHRKSL